MWFFKKKTNFFKKNCVKVFVVTYQVIGMKRDDPVYLTWQDIVYYMSVSHVIVLISIQFLYMSLWFNLIFTYISFIQFSYNFFLNRTILFLSLNWSQIYYMYKYFTNIFLLKVTFNVLYFFIKSNVLNSNGDMI